MTGMDAIKIIIDKLLSDVSFVSKLTSYGGYPCIVSGLDLPADWNISYSTVNVYALTEVGQYDYDRIRLSASCRAKTYKESRDIAVTLAVLLNRTNTTGFSITTSVSSTIGPVDGDITNYMTPVEIFVRSA